MQKAVNEPVVVGQSSQEEVKKAMAPMAHLDLCARLRTACACGDGREVIGLTGTSGSLNGDKRSVGVQPCDIYLIFDAGYADTK